MLKIVVDDKIPFLKGALEPFAMVEYYSGNQIINKVVKNTDALIVRTRTIINEELLKGSRVKYVASATIGFDHIDIEYCNKNNIIWTNAPGCNSGSVMQYIASVLVTLAKKHEFDLSKKVLGIIGVGNVGSKVAKLADALGMKVLLNDPPRERKEGKGNFVSIEEIQQKADIITFHVPLIREGIDRTYHMFDDFFLDALQRNPIIINSSRGKVVTENALKKGLREKKIKSIVLDVWDNEPNIDLELLNLTDIATPHIAGYSVDGKANGTKMVVQAISRYFNLGIDNWLPTIGDKRSNYSIEIDSIADAILQTYNVLNDDKNLRNNPFGFEKQRNEYAARREFFNYRVSYYKEDKEIKSCLKSLGFLPN